MTPDALHLAADIIQTAGRVALALVLLGITATAALIIGGAHLAEVRRALDRAALLCHRCGTTWCDCGDTALHEDALHHERTH